MSDFKMTKRSITSISAQGQRVVGATTAYMKTHFIDFLLLFLICLVLGAFDVFVLKRSENLGKPEYWYHAGCRIVAYVLASVLGVRVGYPKAKAACEELKDAAVKNQRLCRYKDADSVMFGAFIASINAEVKKSAWKAKIKHKLAKLEKRALPFFALYYRDRKESHFNAYGKRLSKVVKQRAENYCAMRETFEQLLDDNFIEENIDAISVNYYRVSETDFNLINGDGSPYKYYKTRANVKSNAARVIGTSFIFTMIATLIIGSVKLSFDEAEAVSRILAIATIIINAILDVGITLWKFMSAYADGDRIVRTEDLRAYMDQNELLVRYKKTLPPETIEDIDRELAADMEKNAQIQNALQNA